MPPVRQQTAAVRDFDPANVRFGSKAAKVIGTVRRLMSASPPKADKQSDRSLSLLCAKSGLMHCSKQRTWLALIPFDAMASVLRVQQSGGIGFSRCRHQRVGDEGAASAVVLNVEVARCERRSFCVQPFRGRKMWYSSLERRCPKRSASSAHDSVCPLCANCGVVHAVNRTRYSITPSASNCSELMN
jgi:hypothetical protein